MIRIRRQNGHVGFLRFEEAAFSPLPRSAASVDLLEVDGSLFIPIQVEFAPLEARKFRRARIVMIRIRAKSTHGLFLVLRGSISARTWAISPCHFIGRVRELVYLERGGNL